MLRRRRHLREAALLFPANRTASIDLWTSSLRPVSVHLFPRDDVQKIECAIAVYAFRNQLFPALSFRQGVTFFRCAPWTFLADCLLYIADGHKPIILHGR